MGSIPALIKTCTSKTKFKPSYLIFTFITLLFGICLVILEKNISRSKVTTAVATGHTNYSGAGSAVPVASSFKTGVTATAVECQLK